MNRLQDLINDHHIRKIADKVVSGDRLSPEEGLLLYEKTDLSLLAFLSGIVRNRKNNRFAYFIRNFHIEPTNTCVYNCRFCSYRRNASDPQSWDLSQDQMLDIVRRFDNKDVREVHIVGGVHPSYDLHYYGTLIRKIKEHRPSLHVKAFSAPELEYMIKKSGMDIRNGLMVLKEYGLDSIPGGGAEIFDEKLRSEICREKTSSEMWLAIHEAAHSIGIPSNATMLYGHVESYSHRIDHMERLRLLQDRTSGFNAFIPLKFRKANNSMHDVGEVSIMEDLRNYAVARIYLDNIPHIKTYWPMTGKNAAQLSLTFGTDDFDGTIDDTTRIYSMAGAEEQNPAMTASEICKLIVDAGYEPVERDSLYNRI